MWKKEHNKLSKTLNAASLRGASWENLKQSALIYADPAKLLLGTKALIVAKGSNYVKMITGYYIAQVKLDLLLSAVALENYKAEQGSYPDSLNQLVATYLANIPTDPFNDFRPLYYKPATNSFLIYSVGIDKKDNKGKNDIKFQR